MVSFAGANQVSYNEAYSSALFNTSVCVERAVCHVRSSMFSCSTLAPFPGRSRLIGVSRARLEMH